MSTLPLCLLAEAVLARCGPGAHADAALASYEDTPYAAAVRAVLRQLPPEDVALVDRIDISPDGTQGMTTEGKNCGEAWTLGRRVVLSDAPNCYLWHYLPFFLAHEFGHMRQAADGWPNQYICPGPTPPNLPLSGGGYCWQLDEPDANAYAHEHGF